MYKQGCLRWIGWRGVLKLGVTVTVGYGWEMVERVKERVGEEGRHQEA